MIDQIISSLNNAYAIVSDQYFCIFTIVLIFLGLVAFLLIRSLYNSFTFNLDKKGLKAYFSSPSTINVLTTISGPSSKYSQEQKEEATKLLGEIKAIPWQHVIDEKTIYPVKYLYQDTKTFIDKCEGRL